MLVVLVLVAAVTSLLEWMTRNRPTHWHAVGEAVAVTALLVATQSASDLGAYLAVPPIAAGVRHGLVTDPQRDLGVGAWPSPPPSLPTQPPTRCARSGETVPWLAIGLGVGLLASLAVPVHPRPWRRDRRRTPPRTS